MATRTFRDKIGRVWEVWEVFPTSTERRVELQAVGVDRRRSQENRISLPNEMKRGWLTFQTRGEKRRLAPHPENWAQMSDDELGTLLELATLTGPPKRLIE